MDSTKTTKFVKMFFPKSRKQKFPCLVEIGEFVVMFNRPENLLCVTYIDSSLVPRPYPSFFNACVRKNGKAWLILVT